MEVGEEVGFTVRARFGKRSGLTDYEWLTAVDSAPKELLPVCEPLVQACASANTLAAIIARGASRIWLIRTYHQGLDAADRPIVGLEVAEAAAESLTPENMLGLAATSINSAAQKQARERASFSLTIPPISVSGDPAPPEPRLQARARLGLPIGVSVKDALFLTRAEEWRYQGICFFNRETEHRRGTDPFLCVNVGLPELAEDDEKLLEAVLKRPPSREEWAQLNRVDPIRVRAALRWAASPDEMPAPFTGEDDGLISWLIAFRGARHRGPDLLLRLRQDLHSIRLPFNLVKRITAELSPETAQRLTGWLNGNREDLTPRMLDELARASYLDNEALFPIRYWIHFLPRSNALAKSALKRFTDRGIAAEAAGFVLDLADNGAPVNLPPGLEQAAQTAVELNCPPPRRALSRALKANPDRIAQDQLLRICSLYGEQIETAARLTLKGEVPKPGTLTIKQLAEAIENSTAVNQTFLKTLAELRQTGREKEAEELFRLAQGQEITGLRFDNRTYDALAANLKLDPPLSLPPLDELRALAQAGLAEPEDIVLNAEDCELLAPVASLWPRSSALASLLSGAEPSGSLGSTDSFSAPETWLPAVQESLTPNVVSRLLNVADSQVRQNIRKQVSILLGFDADLAEALCGYGPLPSMPDSAGIAELLQYLPVFIEREPRARRLQALTHCAEPPLAKGNEPLGERLARALLPEENASGRELALYTLTRRGSPPRPEGVAADLLIACVPALDIVELVDELFACERSELTQNERLIEAVVNQLKQTGARPPERGYNTFQRSRHFLLTENLAAVPGWESLSPDINVKRRRALAYLEQLGLSVRDLSDPPSPPD